MRATGLPAATWALVRAGGGVDPRAWPCGGREELDEPYPCARGSRGNTGQHPAVGATRQRISGGCDKRADHARLGGQHRAQPRPCTAREARRELPCGGGRGGRAQGADRPTLVRPPVVFRPVLTLAGLARRSSGDATIVVRTALAAAFDGRPTLMSNLDPVVSPPRRRSIDRGSRSSPSVH
jgi:hypothetical protein